MLKGAEDEAKKKAEEDAKKKAAKEDRDRDGKKSQPRLQESLFDGCVGGFWELGFVLHRLCRGFALQQLRCNLTSVNDVWA